MQIPCGQRNPQGLTRIVSTGSAFGLGARRKRGENGFSAAPVLGRHSSGICSARRRDILWGAGISEGSTRSIDRSSVRRFVHLARFLMADRRLPEIPSRSLRSRRSGPTGSTPSKASHPSRSRLARRPTGRKREASHHRTRHLARRGSPPRP